LPVIFALVTHLYHFCMVVKLSFYAYMGPPVPPYKDKIRRACP